MKNKLAKAKYSLGIVLVLSAILVANLTSTTEVQGACTNITCTLCTSGKRYQAYCSSSSCDTYVYSKTSGSNKCNVCGTWLNFSKQVSCTNCGGDGVIEGSHSWSNTHRVSYSTCTTQGEWRYKCSKCGQIGATPHYDAALGHAYPSDFTYVESNGLANGARYMDCTRGCGTRLHTQYACWVYAGDGISSVAGTNWYDYGTNVTISATPSEGCTWNRWEWTGGGVGADNPFTFWIDRAYQFFAYGEKIIHTIQYDANGGTNAPEDQRIEYNTDATLSDSIPTRTGYTFRYWTTTIYDNGDKRYEPGGLYPGVTYGGSQTLYAQWSPNQYNLAFVPNGGTFKHSSDDSDINSATMTYNTQDNWNVSWGIAERKGYTFKGWYTAIDGGVQVYDENNACTNEGTYFSNNTWIYPDDVTLYARWEGIPRTVTYNANGGTTPDREFVKYYDDVIDLSLTSEKPGYIFVGWNTSPDATTGLSDLKMQEEDITLYAIYSINVSDIANHSYDENGIHSHTPVKEQEVFFLIWEDGNTSNYRIYPLSYEYVVSTMVYRYKLDSTDASKFVSGMDKYHYQVIAYDNAGNAGVILSGNQDGPIPDHNEPKPPDILPEKYLQTVYHYRHNPVTGEYEKFNTTTEEVEEGKRFTPMHIGATEGYQQGALVYPEGYVQAGKISNDGSYVVTEGAVSRAYYDTMKYDLTFNANGGKIEVNPSMVGSPTGKISYNNYYGSVGFDYDGNGTYNDGYGMPTPTRDGYTFEGWYTGRTGGDRVLSSDRYVLTKNSTLYAHWSVNNYQVTFDYWTNGGTSASLPQESYDFGKQIELSTITATKAGTNLRNWTFVGWNTHPDAKTGLRTYTVTSSDATLYAIFKKDITVTLIEKKDTGTATKNITKTIYNNQTDAEFVLENTYLWSGWTLLGWTIETGAEELPSAGNGSTYIAADDETFYALYSKEIRLNYEMNGASGSIEGDDDDAHYNTYGNSSYPSFTAAVAPTRTDHSFINWRVESGIVQNEAGNRITTCKPGEVVTILDSALLCATWDAYPALEVYNRHFTLEQAQKGKITETELLRRVKARDEEAKHGGNPEGILENGRDVIVMDYDASRFTSLMKDSEMEMTFKATDSFGNTVLKSVIITVTDTSLRESAKKSYVRFISREFFGDAAGNLVPKSKGGLEETSIWRINEVYRELLRNTLYRTREEEETWEFTKKDIEEMKKKL